MSRISALFNYVRKFLRSPIEARANATRFGPNRVAADIQRHGGDDFLVKTELRFRMDEVKV